MKILLLDIETAPNKVYSWGLWQQDIHIDQIEEPGYTLCWAAKWLGERKVMFASVQDGAEAMVKQIHELVCEADAIAHYNGRKFDMPHLKREFLHLGLPPPFKYVDIDLLSVVRREFKFQSNKLDYVSQQLGLGSKVKHKGMTLWRECMAGDPKAWAIMKRYNKQDVVLLEKVYEKLLPWIRNHPNHGLYKKADDDRPTCKNCGSRAVKKNGMERLKTGIYPRYRCTSCQTPMRGRLRAVSTPGGILV